MGVGRRRVFVGVCVRVWVEVCRRRDVVREKSKQVLNGLDKRTDRETKIKGTAQLASPPCLPRKQHVD